MGSSAQQDTKHSQAAGMWLKLSVVTQHAHVHAATEDALPCVCGCCVCLPLTYRGWQLDGSLRVAVAADNACVRPLFAHMFIPAVGPSLALCGLPWRCAKFPQFQLQGQLLARLLSGRAALPPQQVMEQVGCSCLGKLGAADLPSALQRTCFTSARQRT